MSQRALMPDHLRLVALFGIVVVNVQYIAFSVFDPVLVPPGDTIGDAVTLWLVNGLALLKSYGLFSFMFGVGLGFLMRATSRRGLPFGRIYRNRMVGLALLGLAHGCLFFSGDILVIYAVMGSVLYLMRDWPVRRLVRWGAVLLVVQLVIAPPLLLMQGETPADFIAFERMALGEGGFAEAALFRAIGFAVTLPAFLAIQGISALGWFCLGLAAVRSGMIGDPAHPLWRRARRVCLVPGLGLSLTGAALWQWGPHLPGAVITLVAAPLTTLGYLGAIAGLPRPPGPFMARLLEAGGSSLSIYLGQSILLSTVFSAYGLGLWEQVSRPVAVLIAMATTAALIAALVVWRQRFRLGPFEWLLRRMTYRGIRRSRT